ncbi:MAG: PKD domain-containing protein [Gemmataceae bacterium]|nr:PKD domain-containing protein [Gemmataceae bacterium]
MADEKAASKIPGWLKAVGTSLFGLVSGAALMYLTPLVNNVIKPGKPLPNFAQQASNLTVTFNNRSTGGTQGWWDFGDGSALEPFEPDNDVIVHSYPRPGNYQVKLTLQNLLGEQAERTVAVNLEGATAPAPAIDAFAVVPVSAETAPATYKVVSQVRNARLVAWDLGEGKLKTETNPTQEKFVTLREPGDYRLRLLAFNGDQVVEESKHVFVGLGDSNKPMATLKVVYEGVRIEQKAQSQTIVLAWDPKHQGATCPAQREFAVAQGWIIANVKLVPPGKEQVRGLKAEVLQAGARLRVSGELVKPKNVLTKKVAAPQCVVGVHLTLVRRSGPVTMATDAVAFELMAPGSTPLPVPPPPAGLEVQGRRFTLEIKDGQQVVWNTPGLPTAAPVAMKSRLMRVTAVEQGHQLRVDVVEAKGVIPVSRPSK